MFHSGGKIPTPLVGFYFETLFSFINSSYNQKKMLQGKKEGVQGGGTHLVACPSTANAQSHGSPTTHMRVVAL